MVSMESSESSQSKLAPNLDNNGVDLDVLDYYLAMTPTERYDAHSRLLKVLIQTWKDNGIEPVIECEYAP